MTTLPGSATSHPLDIGRIVLARDLVAQGLFNETPLLRMPGLEREVECGQPLYLKLETMQAVGSFKLRGAATKMAALEPYQLALGVVAASAGNHSQGVAVAARRLGIEARIVMPINAPADKVRRTIAYGARVHLHGSSYDEAEALAYELAEEEGGTFVHAFDDWDVMAGQGTIGLEILDKLPNVGTVLVPVGGGGLLGGISAAIKAVAPRVRVIGVQSANAPSALVSFRRHARTPVPATETIADGIRVGLVGERCFEAIREFADDIVMVTDDELCHAMLTLEQEANLIAEPAAAAPLAALQNGRVPFGNGPVVCVLTGANMDTHRRMKCLRRCLKADRKRKPTR